ncbi:MAG: PAS domain-containing protein [Rhodospirillaceae bacterium]|nr:PAS domain-containing protein [Rhodospirillales bacterium]
MRRYLFAVLIFFIALIIRLFALPVEAGLAFVTMFPAVAIAALFFGIGPGLMVLLLGGVVGFYAFMPPFLAFKFSSVEFAALAMFFTSGVIVCLIVNQMHRARIALAASEANLRAVMNAVPAAIWIAPSPSGADIHGNRFANDLLGIEEGVNASMSAPKSPCVNLSIIHDGVVLRAEEMPLQRAAKGETISGYEFDIQFEGGRCCSLFGHAVPLRDQGGHTSGAVAAFIDVTGMREAASALRAVEKRLLLSIESAPAGIAMFDRNMRYIAVSRRFAEDYRVDFDGLLGRSHYEVFPEMSEQWRDVHRRCLDGATERCVEDPFPRADGTLDWVSWEIRPWYEGNGTVGGIVIFSEVISWRKQVEDDLRAAKAEAERANIGKSKFLAAASHDLRQPVQALVLLLEALKAQATTQTVAKAVDLMGRSLEGLNGLLTSILDVSRIEAGVVTADMQSTDVTALARRLCAEYAPLCQQKDLKFRCFGKTGLLARTDATLLERMMRNLIENAIRYTDRGGLLIATRRRGDRLRIDVVDTGIGIPANKQPHIFEEFYQVANPARDSKQGLGLGLSIVSRLAGLIDAQVQLRSHEGRGTCFTVLVPRHEAVIEPCLPAVNEVVTGLRIMVIEDNPTVRQGFQLMLGGWNCHVLEAETGEQALHMGAQEGWRFDFIIADHRLGAGLSGTAAAAEICKRAGRSIPTLIVTGDTDPERIKEVHASGFEMAHKPIGPVELAHQMTKLLRVGQG